MTRHTRPARIVILGGGYAGLTFAERFRKRSGDADITLIDSRPAFEDRNRFQQVAAGESRATYSYSAFLDPMGVRFKQGTVISLDPESRILLITDANGHKSSVNYDYLVYALGSKMGTDRVPGVQEHSYTLNSNAQSQALHHHLQRHPAARVLVVGGGLTGIETAAELAEAFPEATLSLAPSEPLRAERVPGGFCEKTVRYLEAALQRRSITVCEPNSTIRVQEGIAIQASGTQLPFDICIWTAGFSVSPLAKHAGIQTNPQGQIVVDPHLRSLSHPNILAIGDAACARSARAGDCRMGSATALAMATSAAKVLSALLTQKPLPEFQFVYLFRNICLGRHDGVVQFVDRQDVPRDLIWTGATAAAWKEYICHSTLTIIGLAPAGRRPALPPLRTLLQLTEGLRQYA